VKGKLSAADWHRIELGLEAAMEYDSLGPAQRAEYEATLDRIQFHNKTGVYALKVIH
jgi:hypothetical protein